MNCNGLAIDIYISVDFYRMLLQKVRTGARELTFCTSLMTALPLKTDLIITPHISLKSYAVQNQSPLPSRGHPHFHST